MRLSQYTLQISTTIVARTYIETKKALMGC
jgi:hypothetical protein